MEGKTSFMYWLIFQVVERACAQPGTTSGSPTWVEVSKDLSHLPSPSQEH